MNNSWQTFRGLSLLCIYLIFLCLLRGTYTQTVSNHGFDKLPSKFFYFKDSEVIHDTSILVLHAHSISCRSFYGSMQIPTLYTVQKTKEKNGIKWRILTKQRLTCTSIPMIMIEYGPSFFEGISKLNRMIGLCIKFWYNTLEDSR